jgi:hypothetical protein
MICSFFKNLIIYQFVPYLKNSTLVSETDGKGIKGGLISDDIFTLVSSSKITTLNLSTKIKIELMIAIFLIC